VDDGGFGACKRPVGLNNGDDVLHNASEERHGGSVDRDKPSEVAMNVALVPLKPSLSRLKLRSVRLKPHEEADNPSVVPVKPCEERNDRREDGIKPSVVRDRSSLDENNVSAELNNRPSVRHKPASVRSDRSKARHNPSSVLSLCPRGAREATGRRHVVGE
jgi:hypothetical protein